jgi:hypothetical protein
MLSLGMTSLAASNNLGKRFTPYAYESEPELTSRVKQAIDNHEAPPIVLAYGGAHWVVVRDYDPEPGSQSGVSAFYINDPLPALEETTPGGQFDHAVGDKCGTSYELGHMYRHVAYSRWKARYATPCCFGTTWEGLYIAVCEGPGFAPPAGVPAVSPYALNPFISRTAGIGPDVSCSGCQNPTHTDDEIKKAAEASLAQLENVEPWATLLPDLEPGQPICVCRDAPLTGYYYLVPIVRKDDDTIAPVAVAIDGDRLEYEECVAVPDPHSQGIPVLDMQRDLAPLEIELHWFPHQKSFSPFYPHAFEPNQIHTYKRLDRHRFDELKVPEHGGA